MTLTKSAMDDDLTEGATVGTKTVYLNTKIMCVSFWVVGILKVDLDGHFSLIHVDLSKQQCRCTSKETIINS